MRAFSLQSYSTLGNLPDESFIPQKFEEYHSEYAYDNSIHYWWNYGIWGTYTDVPTEAMCAFKCYLDTVERCSYYFWGNGRCQLGHYNYRGKGFHGTFKASTLSYMVRKDLGK